ncbi:unnamed protein product [Prorocentrum cordatum]|uniref:Uncharacterized protein n=1 Tax=Prorocentrum cordatum TaxID=2364126 RepID=A0ABN9SNH8_9DINO|nr:unnamed protein product [Polarella glacialis]
MEVAEATRKKANADYEDAVREMDQAIAALTSAIEVLKEATEDHQTGVLMEVGSEARQRFKSQAAEAEAMSYAATLGDKFLSTGDAVFLRRLLTGEVPTVDWKKLNRKATFRMSYKARSAKIQDVLAGLLETFTKNREQAAAKEAAATESHAALMASKGAQREAAQMNLANMDKENGAKSMSREEAMSRVEDLGTQHANDEKYIQQVEAQLAEKKEEWSARSTLRAGEIKAISQAIAILHSDDAKDIFKRSMTSQGYLFLQTSLSSLASRSAAARVLRAAAAGAHDARLAELAAKVEQMQPRGEESAWVGFEPVLTAIDSMLQMLQEEEADDRSKKESCEQDRADDTRGAIKASRAIDEMTDAISASQDAITQLDAELAETAKQLEQTEMDMEAIKKQRSEEHAAYLAAKKDDEDAAAMVASAKDVIHKFYHDNGLMFTQGAQNRSKEPVRVSAGKAPPPPPRTWEAPYGGKQAESTGLVAILGMIHEDIERDAAKAAAAEEKASKAAAAMLDTLTEQKTDLNQETLQLTQAQGRKTDDIQTNTESRRLKKQELGGLLSAISLKEPGCNYFTVNFLVRAKNRQIETDGLQKAKAILQGAKFDAKNPDREIVPGDSLLQGVRRH